MADKKEHDIDIDDLQAAIDASAHATVSKKAEKDEEAKWDEAEAEVAEAKEDAPKEKASDSTHEKPAESKADSSDDGHSVAVKIKKTPAIVEPSKKEDDTKSDEPAKEAAPIAHRGKKIAPLTEEQKKAAAEPEAVEEAETPSTDEPKKSEVAEDVAVKEEPEAKSESIAPSEPEQAPAKSTPSEGEKVAQAQDDVKIKIEGLQTANLKEEAQKAEEAEDEDPTKIYDTKEYHLPIKANRHHRKPGIPNWLSVLILIALLAASAAYAYFTTDLFA